jgi:hypothetical protein
LVELADRMPLIRWLYYHQNDPNRFNTKEIREEFENFKKRFNSSKLFDLIKIKGTVEQVEKQIKNKSHILCRKRFLTALEYFIRLRDNLAIFGITEKDESKTEPQSLQKGVQVHRQLSELKKESVLVFDFGLMLK